MQSPQKPKTKPAYEVVNDRKERDDEGDVKGPVRDRSCSTRC
ncbi:MAG TPA: hypothetical protein PKY67_07785 [Nitrosomonas sp.]|nr:hypothetical protein [Nitrosomonas sp.]